MPIGVLEPQSRLSNNDRIAPLRNHTQSFGRTTADLDKVNELLFHLGVWYYGDKKGLKQSIHWM